MGAVEFRVYDYDNLGFCWHKSFAIFSTTLYNFTLDERKN